ncbi:MAG: hypothetical protein JWM47_2488 [Acidimicrobiales bacterium]|nr:hypothetical protein [Acidimicrobiales bacterium]
MARSEASNAGAVRRSPGALSGFGTIARHDRGGAVVPKLKSWVER